MKLMQLMESDEHPNVHSSQAKLMWFKINNYVLLTDDPKFDKIRSFRRAIVQLTDPSDREQMIAYFNSVFTPGINGIAWDYYK